jgi:phospholipase D1/2
MKSETVIKQPASISQVIGKDGTPSRANHTELLWVDKRETDVFSAPTAGNKIESLTTGQDYFERLIHDCDKASSEVYIAGWQVNWDALLVPGVRVYDLIFRCAARGVNVYVMPWDDTEPVQTYDDQTKVVLESINARVAESGGTGRVCVELCKSFASTNNSYFSHHQKQVVVDRRIAFVGGIDLAYGRMDDASYDLRADANGREMLNRYNPGIPPLEVYTVATSNTVDPDRMVGALDSGRMQDAKNSRANTNGRAQGNRGGAGAWQVRYEKAGMLGTAPDSSTLAANTPELTTLDPKRQPRMPWQDVHCRIEGPAVSDLIRNFVLRWNVVSKTRLAMPKPPSAFPKQGNAQIQVLRSAPLEHCRRENQANNIKTAPRTQQDIHVAMINLINKARSFIYIEQQFFVSDFGRLGGALGPLSPATKYIIEGEGGIGYTALRTLRLLSKGDDRIMDRLPHNGVLPALLARFEQIILDDVKSPEFHVYITLPVHPEGALSDATIAVQVYYTMQTLVFGSHSLLNGIKRLIKARELRDKGSPMYRQVIDDPQISFYEDVPDEACSRYVTLLNLRNWVQLGKSFTTDQIYVHSKVMIVDDRFALIGSANINDRSLLGERDSELAVLVMDDDIERVDVNGNGNKVPVRVFAHELRKKIWNKIFGITSGVRPAKGLKDSVDAPGDPRSWKLIQAQAFANSDLYERVFAYIPRSFSTDSRGRPVNAKILPTWRDDLDSRSARQLVSPMPFEAKFWQAVQTSGDTAILSQQRGFITALPIGWTKGENIRIKFPAQLIVEWKNPRYGPGTDNVTAERFASSSDNKTNSFLGRA